MSFSPDGRILASGSSDGAIQLWEVSSGQHKATLRGHGDSVTPLAFSPDGRILASGSRDMVVMLWDMSPYIMPQSTTEVEVTILGTGVDGLTVEFARSIADRRPHYAWSATTDATGHVALTITNADPDGISGLYEARARNESGEVVGQWNSISLNESRHQTLELTLGGDVRVVASEQLDSSQETMLAPNAPNPFNTSTQIAYHLAAPGPVRLEIYNALGQPVRTLVDQVQTAGMYQVHWDACDQGGAAVAAGVYITRLHHPSGVQTRRLLYLK